MLMQEWKRFDVVSSMKVVEHVDSPAMFLRLCAELIKVHFLAAFLFVDMQLRLFMVLCSLSFLAAWRTPFLCSVGW
jgi:2-polyprenyl-3-methyl-5-hydroxy-6-metoxy-1,4-benzoquinol methylase